MRKGDEDWMKKCMEYRVEGRRPVGRPIRTWLECYEEEVQPYPYRGKTDFKTIIYIYIYMGNQGNNWGGGEARKNQERVRGKSEEGQGRIRLWKVLGKFGVYTKHGRRSVE